MTDPIRKSAVDAPQQGAEEKSAEKLDERKQELEAAIKELKSKVEERENAPHTF